MADHFLVKSNIDLAQCLEHEGGLALEAYPALHAFLSERAGPETARIFAEPLLSRGNDTAAPSISWYTDLEGSGQPVARLDDAGQSAIAAELSQHLHAVRGLLDDPECGPLLAAALHLSDPNDVWSVGGRPVILNWGMLPKGAARDGAARAAHYANTLGRYLPLVAAPPITQSERQAWQSQRNGGQSMTEDTPQNTAPAGSTETAAPPPTPSSRRVPLSAWLPLVLLLILAGGVLAWLLVPGSRIFPDITQNREITDEATLAAAEGVNRSLEERLAKLQDSLDRAVCTDDGSLLMPDGRTIEGLLPPDPNDPEDKAGAVRTAEPRSILPPDPERVRVAEPNGPKDTVTLLAHIEERTAIVIAPTNNGLANGTGFFVGPDLLVTNHHVVAAAGPQGIFVTNASLGKLHQAQVLKSLGPFQSTGGDFALLRVPGVQQPAFSILDTNQTLKLQSVIAAGYPGDLLQTDDQFQRLRSGNAAAVPDLAVTDGTVSTEQSVNSARMIAHSAPISKGNSGGPLIDMCGRVIGVNTFIKQGTARTLNFALASSDLMRFLQGTDALPNVVTEACAPRIERPEPPATAALDTETGIQKLPPLKKSE